ncbi:hypothetical protein GE21DRAFT_6959 [Neurospora crassa]|uniref:Uncharacterized protein n=2 Tax=Neurospora crassa TaxID=5141 RepID=A7UX99_NEUCR|nr:hypothetical protein NCU11087 [Neurospora crassa OR74A]EDO64946.1 hypothetical protein NCU11087 [Neurospora crassa OR74A]KHE81109.1 hypothetical protein GE21DRAFT_6959 [Neurospora crassa]CAD70757.1 hypothetical protein [Neurospora crassa]|eukprot:XP_001728037.1 hypothetical protein NCU11087 [Neurospora crassa OR74A]
MEQARRPARPEHHTLPVDCDEPGTPPKSLGQKLTGEQEEQLESSVCQLAEKIVVDQWKAKKKKEEEEEKSAAAKAAQATWVDDMGVD